MSVPTITAITPTSGATSGRQLIEVTGTNFALPAAPPTTGPCPAPVPSVRVTIGGRRCPAVFVISSTLLRALTPIHDPSGIPQTDTRAAVPASDLTVTNLDSAGAPITGETATLTACYSFHRPIIDGTVTTAVELAIKQLVVELARQVHDNVQFQPHTDYDEESGDGLNTVQFARLPGIGLTGLKLPTSKDIGDREQPEVDIGGGLVAVRRQPLIRDVLLTCMCVSDSTRELLVMESWLQHFARKNGRLELEDSAGAPVLDNQGAQVGWTLDYQRGEPETFTDRTAGVEWFTAEFAIRRVQETDMPGVTSGVCGLGEATGEIAYKVGTIAVAAEKR